MPDPATSAETDQTPAATLPGSETAPPAGAEDVQAKTYTEKEVQSEVDRRNGLFQERIRAERETEKKQAEADALAEQGKFKELHENSQKELAEAKALAAKSEFQAQARKELTGAGLGTLADTLLAPATTVEELMTQAKALKDGIDRTVVEQVKVQLGTGVTPVATVTGPEVAPGNLFEKSSEYM